MISRIKAISYYLPGEILTNDDLASRFPDLKIDDLTRLTGVYERHIAAEDETAADMAAKSAGKLFEEHDIRPGDVDFVLLCTQWSDYITPSTAGILQDRLGIAQSAGALDISQGCTGYIYGLSLAKGLIESGSARNVLLLTAETMTKSIHPEDKSNRAIFGDGAAATLISAGEAEDGPGIGDFIFGTDGSAYEEIIIRYGGARYPLSKFKAEDYKDPFGNIRNNATFYMNGAGIFTFSVKIVPRILRELFEKSRSTFEDIDFFVFHQANQIILETILKKNRIPPEKSIIYLENVGNTVSSTIPIALYQALKEDKVKAGDNVLLAAFGVGLSWGGTIVRI